MKYCGHKNLCNYGILDRLTRKVLYSRNVNFDERELVRPPAEEEESQQRLLVLDPVMVSPSDDEENYEREKDASEDTPVVTETVPRKSTRERRPVD